jgi:Trk-type K+ transport system membrane component
MLTLSLLILAGNTLYPAFLRLILWTLKKMIPASWTSPEWQTRRRTIQFCLDHPRRVYTNLFPSTATWWLVASVVVLNVVDWTAFELLNIGNPVVDSLPTGFRIVAGLFQAFAVRSGGFYIVSISGLRSGLLVLYVLMMYLSAFPVTMTIRNTNVYEERSLGIFADELPLYQQNQDTASQKDKKDGLLLGLRRTLTMTHGGATTQTPSWNREDFIRLQLRSQLGHDLWWMAIAGKCTMPWPEDGRRPWWKCRLNADTHPVFAITSIETGQFERDPVNFVSLARGQRTLGDACILIRLQSTFNIIFEVISAYGCVGISVGIPWNNYSFCGTWHLASKLVLCAVMLRGRHRGLPVSIDRAILLPDESLAWAEEEDAHKRTTSFNSEGNIHARDVFRAQTSASVSANALYRPMSAVSGPAGQEVQTSETERASGRLD